MQLIIIILALCCFCTILQLHLDKKYGLENYFDMSCSIMLGLAIFSTIQAIIRW